MRRIREEQGISRNQLASRIQVGKTALFDLEHGNPGVRLKTLLAVLHELGMDLELVLPNRSEPETDSVPESAGDPPDLPEYLL